MSLFTWFSAKPAAPRKAMVSRAVGRATAPVADTKAPQALMPPKPAGNPAENTYAVQVERRSKRHARREQLYSAIRESMTRAGILSASYKFKVLSLDQSGNQFLVMMDVAPELITGPEKLSQTEALLIQTANVVYNITVTSVYWRCDPKAIVKSVSPPPEVADVKADAKADDKADDKADAKAGYTDQDAFAKTQANPPVMFAAFSDVSSVAPALPLAPLSAVTPVTPVTPVVTSKPAAKSNHDPLLEAEVAAFKRALSAPAQAQPNAALQAAHDADKADKSDKSRTGLRSYTLITGFEDTEMPDSPAMPALSNTQYGDLN